VVGVTAKVKFNGATRVRWRIVGLLVLFSVLNYMLRVDITIAGEPIMHEFHLSPFKLGWAFSAFSVSYTAFMTPAGACSDRCGCRQREWGRKLNGCSRALLTSNEISRRKSCTK